MILVIDTETNKVFELISKTREKDKDGYDCVIYSKEYGYCSQSSDKLISNIKNEP